MRTTKFGHACVRIEHDRQVLVIDPGSWSEQESVDGATAVLITHEHADHLSVDHLRATDAQIFTIGAVAEQIAAQAPDVAARVTIVDPGDTFDAGFPVTAVGDLHAVIHPEMPRIHNSGFVVEAGGVRIFHPGDAFTAPEQYVDVLLLPLHAPWSKTSEVIDFARTVKAKMSVAIHDGLLSANGFGVVDRLITGMLEQTGQEYVRVSSGSEIALG